MLQNPLVSIIARTKDRPKLLKRALQSIAGQTYRPIEVVIVNDSDCDLDSKEIETILGDIELNYLRLEKNTGRARSGNVGIEHARGEYIGFLDDDELYPEHLAVLCNALQKPDCDVVYSDFELSGFSGKDDSLRVHKMEKRPVPSPELLLSVLLFEYCLPLSAVLFKKRTFHANRGFQESLNMHEDWDLLIRAASSSSFSHVPVSMIRHLEEIPYHDPLNTKVEEGFVTILKKHTDKRTVQALYRYCTYKNRVIHKQGELIGDLREDLQRMRTRIDELSGVQEREEDNQSGTLDERADITRQLHEKTRYIDEINASLGWKVLTFYRENIKTFLAPPGTKRGNFYRLTLTSLALLKGKGLPYVYRKAWNVVRRIRAEKNIQREIYQVPVISSETLSVIETKVSVVIPTKNAGPEFRNTLSKIFCQKGIREIEVVVIDSGSHDETLALAKEYGAKVYSIPPHEFNHGTTRNAGAEKATGEYLVFMSQDAIPVGDSCFHEIILRIHSDQKIAVATVKQIPRSDADLFSCWQLWFYNNALLQYQEDRRIVMERDQLRSLSPGDKRRTAQINNVFSCFRKEIFDRYKFNPLPYAEDLDLGMRLIEDHYAIFFMTSKGVIHSHTRGTEYYLERGYADTKTLFRLLEYEGIHWRELGVQSMQEMLNSLHSLYKKINYGIKEISLAEIQDSTAAQLLFSIKSYINAADNKYSGPGDRGIDKFFARISLQEDSLYADQRISTEQVLINQYFIFLDSFFEYLIQSNIPIVGGKTKTSLLPALYKLFAWTCGSLIGNYAVFSDNTEEVYKNNYIEAILASGK